MLKQTIGLLTLVFGMGIAPAAFAGPVKDAKVAFRQAKREKNAAILMQHVQKVEKETNISAKCNLLKDARQFIRTTNSPKKMTFNGQLREARQKLKAAHDDAKVKLARVTPGLTCGGFTALEDLLEQSNVADVD